MESINEDILLIRKQLDNEPEMRFAEEQIAELPTPDNQSFALERYSSELFRQLDIIAIVVQGAAKYMDRTDDFTLEPIISQIGAKVRELRIKTQ